MKVWGKTVLMSNIIYRLENDLSERKRFYIPKTWNAVMKMPAKGVILKCLDKVNKTEILTSAVSFDGGIVLTNGNIFMGLTKPKEKKWLESILEETNTEMKRNARIDERLEFEVFEGISEEVYDEGNINSRREMISDGIWMCPLVELFVERLRPAAAKIKKSKNKDSPQLLPEKLLACFMFLKPREEGNKHGSVDIFNIIDSLTQPVCGQNIIVEWSPFCDYYLFNSISGGIVGRVFGPSNCFFLFDAATSPGSNGAPIFLAHDPRVGEKGRGALIGTVLFSIDDSTLSIGVSLIPVLWRLLPPAVKSQFDPRSAQSSNFKKLLDETVVGIRSGEFASSGVVVDATSGIILTASHSIADEDIEVFHMGNTYEATLIYKTPVDFKYDLAVIKVKSKNCFTAHMTMAEKPARIGEKVYSVGFPIIPMMENADVRPFVSVGWVAKWNPDYIQTTCCVTHGSSGGAIVRNGQLLGLISSILKVESVHYHRINFAVPVTVFRKNVVDYIETGNVESLRELELIKVSHALPFMSSKI